MSAKKSKPEITFTRGHYKRFPMTPAEQKREIVVKLSIFTFIMFVITCFFFLFMGLR